MLDFTFDQSLTKPVYSPYYQGYTPIQINKVIYVIEGFDLKSDKEIIKFDNFMKSKSPKEKYAAGVMASSDVNFYKVNSSQMPFYLIEISYSSGPKKCFEFTVDQFETFFKSLIMM